MTLAPFLPEVPWHSLGSTQSNWRSQTGLQLDVQLESSTRRKCAGSPQVSFESAPPPLATRTLAKGVNRFLLGFFGLSTCRWRLTAIQAAAFTNLALSFHSSCPVFRIAVVGIQPDQNQNIGHHFALFSHVGVARTISSGLGGRPRHGASKAALALSQGRRSGASEVARML